MRWRLLSPELKEQFDSLPGEDKRSVPALHEVLVSSGALDCSFDARAFQRLVDGAVAQGGGEGVDGAPVLAEVESVLSALGVTPFDEGALPPEKPEAG